MTSSQYVTKNKVRSDNGVLVSAICRKCGGILKSGTSSPCISPSYHIQFSPLTNLFWFSFYFLTSFLLFILEVVFIQVFSSYIISSISSCFFYFYFSLYSFFIFHRFSSYLTSRVSKFQSFLYRIFTRLRNHMNQGSVKKFDTIYAKNDIHPNQ